MRLLEIFFHEQLSAFARFEEPQIERQLGAGAVGFEFVQQFLVINGLRAIGERTFLVNVLDAARQAIRRHLALVEAAERLHLARQSARRGKNRSLSQEKFRRP